MNDLLCIVPRCRLMPDVPDCTPWHSPACALCVSVTAHCLHASSPSPAWFVPGGQDVVYTLPKLQTLSKGEIKSILVDMLRREASLLTPAGNQRYCG